jgi:hypothetical protein
MKNIRELVSGPVFLSYRSTEAIFALKLAADLKNAGLNVWVDRLELGPGDDWGKSIETAINSCSGMIVVLSPEYAASRVCRQELARADQMGRPIFPLLLVSVKSADQPLELQRLQFVDFRDWMNHKSYSLGLGKVRSALIDGLPFLAGEMPDPEARYLNSLIANLEGRIGVYEYVELEAELDAVVDYPRDDRFEFVERWGLDSEFELFYTRSDSDGRTVKKPPVILQNALDVVDRSPRFVLLGDPGAGKTTTLQRLALVSARRRRANSRDYPLPIVANLSRWRGQTLDQFLRAHWPFDSDPYNAFRSGEAELYLDGLNEMGIAGAGNIEELRQWITGQGVRRLTVTCRTDDYGPGLNLKLDRVVVREMSRSRVETFARNYLAQDATGLLGAIDGRGLYRLAKNPYLLTALIVVYRTSPRGGLPSNSGALFQNFARVLWDRERRRDTQGWVPFHLMEQDVARLAFSMIDGGIALAVSKSFAEAQIQRSGLLDAAIRASFLQFDSDDVSFGHQLILEYFAGSGLVQAGLQGRLHPRKFKGGSWRDGGHGIEAGSWDQAIISMCGLLQQPQDAVREIAAVNPYLAGEVLMSGVRVDDDTVMTLVDRLVPELEHYLDGWQWGKRQQREAASIVSMQYDAGEAIEEKCEFVVRHIIELVTPLASKNMTRIWSLIDEYGFR